MGKEKRPDTHKKALFGGLSVRDRLLLAGEDMGIAAFAAWCFYDSLWGFLILPVVAVVNRLRYRDSMSTQRRERFLTEYRELLIAVSASLQSGYSVENAFREAEASMQLLYGDDSIILAPLRELNGRVAMRQPIESAFTDFAERYPLAEVTDFALIFGFGKRLGGDYVKNLRRTTEKLEESIEVKQEIATAVAEKRIELRVMAVMPAAIIAYIRLSSPDFISAMYHSAAGALIMTICLVVYAASIYLGRRITDISV